MAKRPKMGTYLSHTRVVPESYSSSLVVMPVFVPKTPSYERLTVREQNLIDKGKKSGVEESVQKLDKGPDCMTQVFFGKSVKIRILGQMAPVQKRISWSVGRVYREQLEEVIRGNHRGNGEDKERVEELCWSSVEEDAVEEDLGDRVSSREGVGVRRL